MVGQEIRLGVSLIHIGTSLEKSGNEKPGKSPLLGNCLFALPVTCASVYPSLVN